MLTGVCSLFHTPFTLLHDNFFEKVALHHLNSMSLLRFPEGWGFCSTFEQAEVITEPACSKGESESEPAVQADNKLHYSLRYYVTFT